MKKEMGRERERERAHQERSVVGVVEVVGLPLPLLVPLPLVETAEGDDAVPSPNQTPKRRLFRRLLEATNTFRVVAGTRAGGRVVAERSRRGEIACDFRVSTSPTKKRESVLCVVGVHG